MSFLLFAASHLFHSFSDLKIFNDVSLSISKGETFALIGENGAGKTTLLNIIADLIQPDSGAIQRSNNLSIAYLTQEIVTVPSTYTVRDYILEGPLSDLEKELKQLQDLLDNPIHLARWGALHEEYEYKGGYKRLSLEETLLPLQLNNELDTPFTTLSPGEKMRAALAKALILNPDLLLLDEPTSHLDPSMTEWLKNMICKRSGATVIVSHDRLFLNKTCNRLIELRAQKLTCYGGNYDYYLKEREEALEREIKKYSQEQEEIKMLRAKIKALSFSKAKPRLPSDRNLMAYDRRGEHHQKSCSRTLNDLKDRLVEVENNALCHPRPKSITGLKFESEKLASQVAIRFENCAKSYGQKSLFSNFSKDVLKNDRIILAGPNGSGKSTLFRCILGYEVLDVGEIHIASGAQIAYLDQEVLQLPMHMSPLEYFEKFFSFNEEKLRRALHMHELGGHELLHKPFGALSLGQRKRLMILHIIQQTPNVLLLDEPTNHLDMLTLEALEKALLQFKGAIIAISHDPTFNNKIAKEIISF